MFEITTVQSMRPSFDFLNLLILAICRHKRIYYRYGVGSKTLVREKTWLDLLGYWEVKETDDRAI
jgi:hypothetical protein